MYNQPNFVARENFWHSETKRVVREELAVHHPRQRPDAHETHTSTYAQLIHWATRPPSFPARFPVLCESFRDVTFRLCLGTIRGGCQGIGATGAVVRRGGSRGSFGVRGVVLRTGLGRGG